MLSRYGWGQSGDALELRYRSWGIVLVLVVVLVLDLLGFWQKGA